MPYEDPYNQYPENQPSEEPPYYPAPAPPAPAPGGGPPAPGPSVPSAPGGGGGGYGGGPFSLPAYPNFRSLGNAPAFNYANFRAPDMKSVMQEPGYAFGLQSGTNALEHSAAAQGRLRTGGTLTDVNEYGQNYGQQFYDNAYRRAMDTYGANFRNAQAAYQPQFATWQLQNQALRDAMLAGYNAQLQHGLQTSAPRGPEPDPLQGLAPEVFGPGGEPPIPGFSSQGDPWTDQPMY